MTIYHYVVIALFLAFAAIDWLGRRSAFPDIAFWRLMGVASFLLYYTIATFAPFLWDEWLGSRQLMNLSALPFAVQVLIGFLVLEFGIYFWHRAMHSWDPLWRVTHQMHHAAERVDIWGDIPLPDMIFGTFRNPREWEGQNGFHDGSTRQILPMLAFRKIS